MEVAPLSGFTQKQLAPLFREEASHWKEQLFWDYKPTLRVVKALVTTRGLPGFVLKLGGDVIGYAYFVMDRSVGFIGGLYVLDSFADQSNYNQLIERLVSTMQSFEHLNRIESQVMPFNSEFASDFVRLGFRALPRYFLSMDLGKKSIGKRMESAERTNQYQFQSWRPQFRTAAADVIHDSYVDSPDLELCRDYQSPKGCARFLRNLIGSPTCGRFSRTNTRVAFDRKGELCGLLLATEIDDGVGMIPQLSVRRRDQGKGIGSRLLTEYMKAATERGLRRVSLSVSLANSRAFELYRRVGFEREKEFHALVWEANSTPDSVIDRG
jgi:ribosomal protein S18 acetylase RimI-like enzyme